ncbi:transposase [Kitasatospora sp. NPDC058218]|uniref:transposase n=1 Tax=Kitasatospora sp. NPDC058218 TaxID=3346385 RepID=UPI0036D9C9E6
MLVADRRPMQLSRCQLSLRPRSGEQVPSLTAKIARAGNPGGTTAMRVRDQLDGLWCDEDFAGWYPRYGRPGISPAQLATVCVPQFLLGLSDRQAAEAVRCRIDFKYAMAMELDDPGFHHSVLADFRERLALDDRTDRLLDLALAHLKEAGLVRERTTQRTDSTHVLASVRDLTRLELVTEAVRAVLEEVARTASHLRPAWSTRAGGAARSVPGTHRRSPARDGQTHHPPRGETPQCRSARCGGEPRVRGGATRSGSASPRRSRLRRRPARTRPPGGPAGRRRPGGSPRTACRPKRSAGARPTARARTSPRSGCSRATVLVLLLLLLLAGPLGGGVLRVKQPVAAPPYRGTGGPKHRTGRPIGTATDPGASSRTPRRAGRR